MSARNSMIVNFVFGVVSILLEVINASVLQDII